MHARPFSPLHGSFRRAQPPHVPDTIRTLKRVNSEGGIRTSAAYAVLAPLRGDVISAPRPGFRHARSAIHRTSPEKLRDPRRQPPRQALPSRPHHTSNSPAPGSNSTTRNPSSPAAAGKSTPCEVRPITDRAYFERMRASKVTPPLTEGYLEQECAVHGPFRCVFIPAGLRIAPSTSSRCLD